jgi:hypothetical protein
MRNSKALEIRHRTPTTHLSEIQEACAILELLETAAEANREPTIKGISYPGLGKSNWRRLP